MYTYSSDLYRITIGNDSGGGKFPFQTAVHIQFGMLVNDLSKQTVKYLIVLLLSAVD